MSLSTPRRRRARAPLGAALAVACLLPALPSQAPSRDASFGVFPFLVGNLDSQVATIVDDAKRHGLDTIYVSVFRATGSRRGDLWITDRAGSWRPSWGPVRRTGAGIDLPQLVTAAHAANIQVVGVLKCFDASVDPTDAAHRAYLLDVVDYLVNSVDAIGAPVYDLDGIALDYVRWVSSGRNRDPRVIAGFCRDVKAVLGPRTLHAYLLAGRHTLDGPVYDGNFNSYAAVRATSISAWGQDWELMAKHVDVMMPMCYTADGAIYNRASLHEAYVKQATAYCRRACDLALRFAVRVSPAIRTYDTSGEKATGVTVEASIKGALNGGGNGYQAFRWALLRRRSDWLAPMKKWAVPGPDLPVAALTAGLQGLTVTADAGNSGHAKQAPATLSVRFDLDGDGSFDTAWAANAPATGLLPGPGTRRIAVELRDAHGHTTGTVRAVAASGILQPSLPLLSARAGGAVDLRLDVGPAGAGRTYLVLASLAGSSPGTVIRPGLVLPLNIDGLTLGLLPATNTPILARGLGKLDAAGRAAATFAVPPGLLTPIARRLMTWATLGADAKGSPAWVSDATTLFIAD